MDEKFYRYVPYAKEKAYEAIGWEFESPLPLPHACYASLYVWRGEGPPIDPVFEISVYPVKKEKTDE